MDRLPSWPQPASARARRRGRAAAASVLVLISVLAAALLALPQVARLEQLGGLRALFHLRGPREPPAEIVVIAIDGPGARRLGMPIEPSGWPRGMHARLIDALARAGVKLIAFDLTFDTPTQMPDEDTRLATAIARAGNVIVVDTLLSSTTERPATAGATTATMVTDTLLFPISGIEQAVLAHAPFILPKQGRVDAYWTFTTATGDLPTLPLVALQAVSRSTLDRLWQLAGNPAPQAEDRGLVETMRALRARLSGGPLALNPAAARSGVPTAPDKRMRVLVAAYAGDEARYLDFYGPPRTIRTLSYDDALDPAVAAGLKGSIAFVGFSGATVEDQDRVRDHYPTVFSGADGIDLSGVEIAATACANLLEGRAIHGLPPLGQFAVVIPFGCALGALVLAMRLRWALPALIAAGALYLAVSVHLFATRGLWLPVLVPLGVQIPLAVLAGTWFRQHTQRIGLQQVRELFTRFLPPQVVEELVAGLDELGSSSRDVHGICLASDLEGYTSFAEGRPPEQVAEYLEDYFGCLFPLVERHRGLVADIAGDAMVAIWPAGPEESALRREACLAALEIAAASACATRPPDGEHRLGTRIGLHAGQMRLHLVGSSSHLEFQAVGDTVNTAARIEGLSKHLGTRLIVSEGAIAGLHEEFLARPLGSYMLAGKSDPLRLYELIATRASADDAIAELCKDFSEALATYENGHWQAAAERFAEILRGRPDDGPARFFAQRCADHAAQPGTEPWSPTIRMSLK